MPRKTETPVFYSAAESALYANVPKWQVWEVAMRLATRGLRGKPEDNLRNGKALTALMDEVTTVVVARNERRDAAERPKVKPPASSPDTTSTKPDEGDTDGNG